MINLHNHTIFSDGRYDGQEIIQRCKDCDLRSVAITDHYATSKINSIHPAELDEYFEAGREWKEIQGINVFQGIEIDSCPYRSKHENFPWDEINGMDLVLVEYIENPDMGGMDLDWLVQLRDKLDIPIGLAHTDIGMMLERTGMDAAQLLDLFEKHDIFIELATAARYSRSGRPYFKLCPEFYENITARNIKVSIGTDTHGRLETLCDVASAWDYIQEQGLEEQVLDKFL